MCPQLRGDVGQPRQAPFARVRGRHTHRTEDCQQAGQGLKGPQDAADIW